MVLGLALTGVLLLANLAKLAHLAWFALGYPYDLDYGEGIVWQQMLNIVAGRGYTPIGVFPAIVYHYPPVYHVTVAALAWVAGLDQLLAGRLVSFVSMLGAMALTGRLATLCVATVEDRRVRLAVGLIAGLCLGSMAEAVGWALTMRVDLLAAALGLEGLLLTIQAARRPALAILAAVLFTLAIYTKQTSIAAPVAAFLGLWMVRRRDAALLLATALALGLPALLALSWATDGGFLHHIVAYNINRLDLGGARRLIAREGHEIATIALAIIGAAAAFTRLRGSSLAERLRADRSLFASLVLLLFLLLKALMLPAMLKSGAASNYLVEWVAALSIFVGLALVPTLRVALGKGGSLSPVLLVLAVVALPFQLALAPDFTPSAAVAGRQIMAMRGIVARIRASAKPVVSDDMTLLIRAGRPVLWEPAIAAELGHDGRYDERGFARLVRRHAFGFFVTEGGRGTSPYDQRYNPLVADAMAQAYPVEEAAGGEIVHLPAGSR